MIGETIAVGVISAGAAIASQFVSVWGNSQSARFSKKIEYLQDAQAQILKFLEEQFSAILSLDAKDYKRQVAEYYTGRDVTNMLTNITTSYKECISSFFIYRHLLPREIRKDCDEAYMNLHTILFTHGRIDRLTDLNAQTVQNVVVNYYTLSGLMFLGLLQKLEEISDKATK